MNIYAYFGSLAFCKANPSPCKPRFTSTYPPLVFVLLLSLITSFTSEFAAKYLPPLANAYRASTGPLNAPMTMLNVISYTLVKLPFWSRHGLTKARPYFIRFQRTPDGSNLASFQAHRTAFIPTNSSETLDMDSVGEITQFLATLLLLQGTSNLGLSDGEKTNIINNLDGWKRKYRGSGRAAEKASERCKALFTCEMCVISFTDHMDNT